MAQDLYAIVGPRVLLEQTWQDEMAVVVEKGKIATIMPVHALPSREMMPRYEFAKNTCLVPGFIDLHIHGANHYDVMDGTVEALQGIAQALACEGVTGFLATTMSAAPARLSAVLKNIRIAMQHTRGAQILGVHLEGPFISQEKMGAQSATQLPNIEAMQAWLAASEHTIKIVTLAPELAHAASLIEFLHQQGVIVSIGHTNATYTETMQAIAMGCTQATHLFNAMRGLQQREPGAVGALLLSDKIHAELIVDGIHLHPAIIELAWRVKQTDKLILVTDAIRAKCLGDGEYELGGQKVYVHDGCATLSDGTLAGSTLSMPQAIKNFQHFTQCQLIEAITLATKNPARILGLEKIKGEIAIGKDADLVVLDDALHVLTTIGAGQIIFRAACGVRCE